MIFLCAAAISAITGSFNNLRMSPAAKRVPSLYYNSRILNILDHIIFLIVRMHFVCTNVGYADLVVKNSSSPSIYQLDKPMERILPSATAFSIA